MKIRINIKLKLLVQFLLIGMTPLIVVGSLAYKMASETLEKAAFDQLESVQQTKKSNIENFFKTVEGQARTLSENLMVVQAAQKFQESFYQLPEENDVDDQTLDEMKIELSSYYVGHFASEYSNVNNGANIQAMKLLNGLDREAIIAQYYYIQKNHHPLGSKHLLDTARDGSSYSKYHKRIQPVLRQYLEEFGYYDIFIVSPEKGHIIYSVFKELDYGSSLINGPYANTNIAVAYQKAMDSSDTRNVHIVDYKPYTPSYDNPAGFISSKISKGGKTIGVLILQVSIDKLNTVMSERAGMGKSGETILVGPDKLMRSDSFLDSENRSVIASFKNPEKGSIDSNEVKAAIAGKSGAAIAQNYLGNEVLVTYRPLNIMGLTWAFLAQINTEEAFAPVRELAYWILSICGTATILIILLGSLIGKSIADPIVKTATVLKENSSKVADASDDLAESSGKLSELATEQASSIEETAASIEEISAMVKNNVEQAEKSSQLSKQVKGIADRSNGSMENLISSMNEIMESNKKIQDLVKVIGEIGEKTEVIDEIVFQTKLLSFNASVEAERAGEHGRGFAVVAQEVGNLAQMSGKAALEIASMVKSSIKNAEAITSENQQKVESSHTLVQETAKYLKEITGDADILYRQAEQIVNSSKEQASGITQVNEAMSQLDQATQQNSDTAEATASSSESLAKQADQLNENVQNLMKLVEGSGRPTNLQSQNELAARNDLGESGNQRVKSLPIRSRSEETLTASPSFQPKQAVGAETFSANADQNDGWDKL